MHNWIDMLIAFVSGILVGAFLGVMTMGLMVAASDRDREEDDWDAKIEYHRSCPQVRDIHAKVSRIRNITDIPRLRIDSCLRCLHRRFVARCYGVCRSGPDN